MRIFFAVLLITLLFFSTGAINSSAAVEWDVWKVLKTEKNFRDVALSVNGKWVFVLTGKGDVLIYTPNGVLKDRISVGDSVDGLKAGPRDDILLLVSRKEANVKIITLDFINDFNIEGSPYKGAVDAPVVIAVFSDFQ